MCICGSWVLRWTGSARCATMHAMVPVSGGVKNMRISAFVNQAATMEAWDVEHLQSRLLHRSTRLQMHLHGRLSVLVMPNDDVDSQEQRCEGGQGLMLAETAASTSGQGEAREKLRITCRLPAGAGGSTQRAILWMWCRSPCIWHTSEQRAQGTSAQLPSRPMGS